MNEQGDRNAGNSDFPRRPRPSKPSAPAEVQLLRDISEKLDRVIAVLAAQGKDKDRQVDILSSAGCDSKFIGIVVGMTGSSVRKFQSRQRRKVKDDVSGTTDDA